MSDLLVPTLPAFLASRLAGRPQGSRCAAAVLEIGTADCWVGWVGWGLSLAKVRLGSAAGVLAGVLASGSAGGSTSGGNGSGDGGLGGSGHGKLQRLGVVTTDCPDCISATRLNKGLGRLG
eukprot:21704-Pleurochrysis_carterae.AAC.3